MTAPGRTYVDIRLSHLLRDCSVGAIVRHDKALMVVQDTRDWDGPSTTPYEREVRYVDLVKRSLSLGGKKLCRPPVKERKGEFVQGWVRARRFPEWTRCNRCGVLYNRPWRKRDEEEKFGTDGDRGTEGAPLQVEVLRCERPAGDEAKFGGAEVASRCGGILEQVPWVLIHDDGYLAEVPWHAIAHDGARKPEPECRPDWAEPYLRVENREGRWFVKCSRRGCGAERPLPGPFPFSSGTRQQPWVKEPPPRTSR